jgi:hypothetical protein
VIEAGAFFVNAWAELVLLQEDLIFDGCLSSGMRF